MMRAGNWVGQLGCGIGMKILPLLAERSSRRAQGGVAARQENGPHIRSAQTGWLSKDA
jgi:hypothetical protein